MKSPARLRCALAALLCAGCLHRVAPQRLADPLPISLAMLEDRGDETRALPEEASARVVHELEDRNLVIHELAPEPLFGGVHNSQQRFAALQAASGNAPFVLLVETRAAYYDLLEGQYRWVVYARLTAWHRGARTEPAVDNSEIPVFLQYAHQREGAALDAAARVLAEKAAELIDGFIAPGVTPAAPSAPSSPFAPPSAGSQGALELPAPSAPALSSEAVRALGNIYFVLIDRFARGRFSRGTAAGASASQSIDRNDPEAFHGGDLQGVLENLDRLQKLGVQTIWLSPVFATRQEKFFGHGAYHGYWVEDLSRVEPRFGDLALLERLSSELHRRGMKLLLDLVLNHVAFDSPLLKSHPDWFHHNGSITDWNDPAQLENRDVDGLPDLAQENEQVYRMLRDTSFHWIDTVHPDGFRLDAVKHVPLAFWRRFNDEVHAHAGPSFVLLGEALEGSPAKLAAIERAGHFDSLFDFPLAFALGDVFCKGLEPERIAAVLSLDRLYPDANALVTLVDNHDLPRAATLCKEDATRTAQLLAALSLMRGVPAIQYGTEAGISGEKEPANRADLFERTDARAAHEVGEALREHAEDVALSSGKTVLLAAGEGAVAIARVREDTATLLLFERAADVSAAAADSARAALLARVLAMFSNARVEGCDAISARGGESRACALAFAPGELRIARLRPARPGAFSFLLAAAPERDVALHLDALHPNHLNGNLYVAGAGPELGDWDPARALGPLTLAAQPGSLRLPARSVAAFKLILKRPDGSVQWESGPDRFLFIPDEREGARAPLDVALAWNA